MSLLVPHRLDGPELLDEGNEPRAEVERSLRDLRRINRYLGGIPVYRAMVRRLVGTGPDTVIDLGTGTSDLLDALHDGRLRVGVDFKIEHLLNIPSTSRVRRVVADARRLPFRDAATDIVTSAHFFHHFSADENAGILRESLRVARKGVAVNDTERHHLPLLFVRMLGVLRLVGRITAVDAPASVLRAYTVAEAEAVSRGVGASRWEVVRYFPFRYAILLYK